MTEPTPDANWPIVGRFPRPGCRRSRPTARPLRDRRGLITRRLTHHIDEINIRHALEHMFDYATRLRNVRKVIHSQLAQLDHDRCVVAGRLTLAFFADDLGVRDAGC